MNQPKRKQNGKPSASEYTKLAGSEHPPHPKAKLLEAAAGAEQVEVTFIVRRRPDGPAIKGLAEFQENAASAPERLSRKDFEDLHGATQSDLDEVAKFCRSHGLRVVDANRSRRSVVARGTAAQMNAAFNITLRHYDSPRGRYRGFEGQVQISATLAGIVEAVIGLDNRPVPARHTSADPSNTKTLTPQRVAQLYNFPSGTGTGQTIGIYEMPSVDEGNQINAGFTSSDLTKTMNAFGGGLTVPNPTVVPAGSNSGTSDGETILDITVASAIAQGAEIVVYFATGITVPDILGILQKMIHPTGTEPVPTILSISWRWAPDDDTTDITPMEYTQLHTLFNDAATLGLTVCTSSGSDSGAEVVSTTQAQVGYPNSDPFVLSCGGTTIGNISGSSFDEYVWNDTFGSNSGATGGGISAQFPVPAYQSTLTTLPKRNGTNLPGRGIPDIAGNASPNSGYPEFLGGSSVGPTGGTSAAAPLYAGLIAIINEILGQNVGFLNPTLYALGTGACRDVTGAAGPANNSFGGVTGYPAGVGWDACTGWGSLDGSALLSVLQGVFRKQIAIVMDRSTFGQDEVNADDGIFQQAIFITVDGFKPSDFSDGGITTLSPTPAQLQQWAPQCSNPTGPNGPTNITITPTSVASDDLGLSPEVQRFTFTYEVVFPDQSAFMFPASTFPEVLTFNASLDAGGVQLADSDQIELVEAGDPYFSSESNGGLYYLSEDLRVFYAEEGSTKFGAPALGSSPADARSFITWIISNISGPTGAGPNGDTFEDLPTDEAASALSLFPTTFPLLFQTPKNIYNFALARVRLDGTTAAEEAKTVRAFFRLFQSQSVAMAYEAPSSAAGSSPSTGAYRQFSDGTTDGQKIPLLGISSDGSEYITVPCFAAERTPNTSLSNNTTAQTDPANVKTIVPVPGSTVYTYFGCLLDNNQTQQLFPLQPGANPDGPFSGSLNTVSQVLDRGGHQCLAVEIVDDEAPIIDGATPATSDKIAQRNLSFTFVANPGVADSRTATHTFEMRPSLVPLNADLRPDELMIDWGNAPDGSMASIYLPAVLVANILDMATRMYATHNLSASDPHTLTCQVGGITYIPVPQGSGPNYAGLFSVELPMGITKGQQFKIVVRQITSSGRKGASGQRYVYGAFQVSIPVSTKAQMLVPEERFLSVMKWIQQTIPTTSRWYSVFLRYIEQLSGRVTALGGNGTLVPPTQTGIWPGLGAGTGTSKPEDDSCTGKVDGIIYDHFGDFEAFILETFEGERRRFESHEPPVHKLVQRAWVHRILTTVIVHKERPERPFKIILHGCPAPLEAQE